MAGQKILLDGFNVLVTVETAFGNGADYIVVGRPIRDAESPRRAAEAMQASIEVEVGS